MNQALLLVTARISDLPSLRTLVSLRSPAGGSPSATDVTPPVTVNVAPERANATLVILCRNSDLDGVIHSVQSVEDRFNRRHGYPYVFLNEEPFDDHFKRYVSFRVDGKAKGFELFASRRLSVLSPAKMEFGIIPRDHWYAPSWIDARKAADARKKMEEDNIIYGGTLSNFRSMLMLDIRFSYR